MWWSTSPCRQWSGTIGRGSRRHGSRRRHPVAKFHVQCAYGERRSGDLGQYRWDGRHRIPPGRRRTTGGRSVRRHGRHFRSSSRRPAGPATRALPSPQMWRYLPQEPWPARPDQELWVGKRCRWRTRVLREARSRLPSGRRHLEPGSGDPHRHQCPPRHPMRRDAAFDRGHRYPIGLSDG